MGCATSDCKSCPFDGCCVLGGSEKFGTLLLADAVVDSSGIAKDIMSTMLETSFLTFSGILFGRPFPFRAMLHKYIASANSGKSSMPDLVVSASVLRLVS